LLPVSTAVVVVLADEAVVGGALVVDDPAVESVLDEEELAAVVALLPLALADPHAAVSAPTPRTPAARVANLRRRVSRPEVRDIEVHLPNGMLLSVPEHLPGRDPLIFDTLNHPDYTTITRGSEWLSRAKMAAQGVICDVQAMELTGYRHHEFVGSSGAGSLGA
jgi:hypothetical protein